MRRSVQLRRREAPLDKASLREQRPQPIGVELRLFLPADLAELIGREVIAALGRLDAMRCGELLVGVPARVERAAGPQDELCFAQAGR